MLTRAESNLRQTTQGSLAGIRVLDFTWALSGPTATLALATLGADVIKVESKFRLDLNRQQYPDYMFHAINRQKRGITLNLRSSVGLDLAKRLALLSDVVVENFRAGVFERMGLGYAVLKSLKSDIIMLSCSFNGQDGPEAKYSGYAPIFSALSGVGELTGYRDGPPSEIRFPADANPGFTCAVAILAALIRRQRTGEGSYIDLSCTEALSCLVGESLLEYTFNGKVATRQGNDSAHLAPHNCYSCKDGWISIAVANEEEWRALCAAMGKPEWTREGQYADPLTRWQNREALDRCLGEWTGNRSVQELVDLLQAVGVAATPSYDSAGLFGNPHIRSRNVLDNVEIPSGGTLQMAKVLGNLSLTPYKVDRLGPALGEHNQEVLGGLLGLTDAEIAALAERGVVA